MHSRLYREIRFDLTRGKTDEQKRTIEVAFSSEVPIRRRNRDGDFFEVLSHDPSDVDLSMLNRNAPFLIAHEMGDQVGAVRRAWIDQDRKGRALVQFGRSARANEIFQDVLDGIRDQISVGYELTGVVSSRDTGDDDDDDDDAPEVRFRWRPYELSLVPVGADQTVGVGRSTSNEDSNMNEETRAPSRSERREHQRIEYEEREESRREEKRRREILQTAEWLGRDFPEGKEKFQDMASRAVLDGTTLGAFRTAMMASLPGVKRVPDLYEANIGMSDREIGRYSLTRAISKIIKGQPLDGLEGEAHNAYTQRSKQTAEGFFIPPDVMVGTRAMNAARQERDLQVGVFGQGGAFVPTIVYTPIIELLRNRICCSRLGAQVLGGLSGSVAIPRQTGAATVYSLPETATLTKSVQALDQVLVQPHRIGATDDYSKQLLLQSSVDVENFIRDDLMKQVAIKVDYLQLNGQGANSEPTGVLNTVGIGSVVFGGAATWANAIAFETALSLANADFPKCAYVTTPSVRAKWKNIAKIGSTFPIFIWENYDWRDGSSDGLVNGYRAAVTNQVLNNLVMFGNYAELILAMWGGFDVVVNPYTRDVDAVVRITVNAFIDVAVRHAQSFCVSGDSGAQ